MAHKLIFIFCVIPLLALFFTAGCGNSIAPDDTGDENVVGNFTVFTLDDGLTDTAITDIAFDPGRNGIWCATLRGISFYSKNESVWIQFESDQAFPKLEFRSIAVDELTGTVWAGTISGAVYYNGGEWEAVDELLGMYINSIDIMADRSIWFGTRAGIEVLYDDGWEYFSLLSGLSHDTVLTVTSGNDGDVWAGTINGISVYDGERWSVINSASLSSVYINKIIRRSDGGMWCATLNGVSVYGGSSWKHYRSGLSSTAVNDIMETSTGAIWAATDAETATFTGSAWKSVELPQAVRNQPVTSLARDTVTGDIWIGTSAGVVRYSTKKLE